MLQKKFIIIAAISAFFPGVICAQIPEPSSTDKAFLESGIVDSNYKFIDIEGAKLAFRELSNNFAGTLPIQINSETSIISVVMTPNYLIFGYKFLIDLDIPQKIEMKNYLHSKEHRDVVCANVFTSRYMIANNNVIALDYYDISNKRIAMIKISPDIK